jgi:hypothetical protein
MIFGKDKYEIGFWAIFAIYSAANGFAGSVQHGVILSCCHRWRSLLTAEIPRQFAGKFEGTDRTRFINT